MFKNGFKRYFWLILLTINNKPKTWSNHQPLTKMFFILKVKLGCSRVWPISLNMEMKKVKTHFFFQLQLAQSLDKRAQTSFDRVLVAARFGINSHNKGLRLDDTGPWLARWSWCRGRHNNVHTLQLTHHPDCNKDTAEEHLGDPPHLKQHQVRKCKTDSRDSD